MPRGTGMAPTRRRNRLGAADPEAWASQLPGELSTFNPVPGSNHFHDHARRIAEWLNTQQPGLGYLTPDVMAAAGLTASAWFQRSLARAPQVPDAFEAPTGPLQVKPAPDPLEGPERAVESSRVSSMQNDENVAQGTIERPEIASQDAGDDERDWWVYTPDLASLPPRPQHGRRSQLIRVGFNDDGAEPETPLTSENE